MSRPADPGPTAGATRLLSARLRGFAGVTAVALVAAVSVLAYGARGGAARRSNLSHETCVAGTTRTTLTQFERLVGFKVHCADIYDSAASTWSTWDDPWFITDRWPANDWTSFASKSSNQLMITLSLIPGSEADRDWYSAGAAGYFRGYARVLATNLIRHHMGHAVIRLGTEANGTWENDSVGDTAVEQREWVEFWRITALTMKAVSGAHFTFDWGVSNGPRQIPFRDYYPGNDVVDSIGVDVYDAAPEGTRRRFGYVDTEAGGLSAIAAFAHSHGKPLIIPEWGMLPSSRRGVGGDPSFVRGIAKFIVTSHVTEESYFFNGEAAAVLGSSPQSVAQYRGLFNPKTGTAVTK
jgi:hypothetical protein